MNFNKVILVVVAGLSLFILPLFLGIPILAVVLYVVGKEAKEQQ